VFGALWVAFALLSRLPVPNREHCAAMPRWSLFWFPPVGLTIGALVGGVCLLGTLIFTSAVAATLGLVFWIWATGALHLDGVADSADGLSARHVSEQRGLEAMRDSRIGAHGAIALVVVLLLKFTLLESMLRTGSYFVVVACVGAAGLSRFWVAQTVEDFPAARTDGLVATLRLTSSRLAARVGSLWIASAVAVAVAAGPGSGSWLLGLAGAACVVSGLVSYALAWFATRLFGGMTGDLCGASIELTEISVLLLCSMVVGSDVALRAISGSGHA
jgi:adenosylcobinamide-GDP ribazoletransferase